MIFFGETSSGSKEPELFCPEPAIELQKCLAAFGYLFLKE